MSATSRMIERYQKLKAKTTTTEEDEEKSLLSKHEMMEIERKLNSY